MSGTKVWCRHCEKAHYDWSGEFCPDHHGTELTEIPETAVQAAEPEGEQRLSTCWQCGADSLRADNSTCQECHESLVPPFLVVDFPPGSVVLRARSTSTMLGRAGEHGRIFASYPNVSRQHATIGVDAAGDAWLAPVPEAPNGTFVNDSEIRSRTALASSDRIRFGTDQQPQPGPVSAPIRQPYRDR